MAYELAKAGKLVEVIEMKDTILDMPDLCAANAAMLKTIIEYYKIPIHTSATINKIDGNHIVYTVNGKEVVLVADSIITSIGYTSDKSLYETIKEQNIATHDIGDPNKVFNFLGAIWDAYEIAMSI